MNSRFLILLLCLLGSWRERTVFHFRTTSDRLYQLIDWNGEIIVEDVAGELHEVKGESLVQFNTDNIVNIRKCKDYFYILKAPNDTTLIIERKGTTDNKKQFNVKI